MSTIYHINTTTYQLLHNGMGIRKKYSYHNSKKAIRIITASSYISHTEPLFKRLNLLKVDDILILNTITQILF